LGGGGERALFDYTKKELFKLRRETGDQSIAGEKKKGVKGQTSPNQRSFGEKKERESHMKTPTPKLGELAATMRGGKGVRWFFWGGSAA